MTIKKPYILIIAVLPFVLAACGGQAVERTAAEPVEAYVRALAAKDADQMFSVSCNAWEEQAQFELDTFVGVETVVEGLACQIAGTAGDYTLVTCQGKIVANYGGENRDFDLAANTYQALQEDGEWRMCGYQP